MIKKLSTKFILLFTAALVCVFFLMAVLVQIVAGSYVNRYIQNMIRSLQDDIDAGVTEVINEAAYLYSRMEKSDHAELWDTVRTGMTQRIRFAAFSQIVAQAVPNDFYFVDVGWHDANGFFSVNGYGAPPDGIFLEAETHKNELILGGYQNGCDILAIYMQNAYTLTEGVIVIYLLESALSDVYSLLNREAGYSYIIRADGYIFSHEDKSYAGKTLIYEDMYSLQSGAGYQVAEIRGVRRIVIVGTMPDLNERYNFNCYLVSVLDYYHYYGDFIWLTYTLIGIAAAVFAGGIALAVIRAKKITRPVENLNRAINEVVETGTKSKRTAKAGDEIYQLEKNYDEMIRRIFQLMRENREEMETKRKLELDALQMQINPHFLYNTLDTVVWMAKIKKEPEIEHLVVNLARFFRLSLHKGDKFIKVEDEINILKHYLQIERIRFPDKVRVIFDVEEDMADYFVLKLVLQPIAENALKHAFPDQKGNLTIRGYADGNDIIFEVEDDGAGFNVPDDILANKRENQFAEGGYGLYNVNERIKLEYGERYGLTVTSKPGKGTKVVVRLEKKQPGS